MGNSNFSSQYIDECMTAISKQGYIELHTDSGYFPDLFKLLKERDVDKNLKFIDYNGSQFVFELKAAGKVKVIVIERRDKLQQQVNAQDTLLQKINNVIKNPNL